MLLLVDHLDLGISGTMASLSLLAEALDRGVRLLATVQAENFLRDIQEFPCSPAVCCRSKCRRWTRSRHCRL